MTKQKRIKKALEIAATVLSVALIIAVIGFIYDYQLKVNDEFEAKQLCLDAGYAGYEKANGTLYCVGIRDGNTVTVKVEDLGE